MRRSTLPLSVVRMDERRLLPRVLEPFAGRRAAHSVLLINPPDPPFSSCNRDASGGYGMPLSKADRPHYPPMDFIYSATCLQQAGVPLRIHDSLGRPVDFQRLRPAEDGLIGVRISYPNLLNDIDFINALLGVAPESAVYIFGPYLKTMSPLDEQRIPAGCGRIVGDPEIPLLRLAFGDPPTETAGVVPPGVPGTGSATPFVLDDLDGLPWPDWSLIPVEQYTMDRITGRDEVAYSVHTSRGCPYKCHYCAYPLGQGRQVRYRSVDSVTGELDVLISRHDARLVIFRDPLFSARPERVRRLLDAIRKLERAHGRPLNWVAETRPDHLGDGLLEAMRDAGCVGINLGLETISEKVCRANGRKFVAPEILARTIARCRELGIHVYAFVLIGLPGDTEETFRETIEFVKAARPHFFNIFPLIPYPGTRLAEWAEERGFARVTECDYLKVGRVGIVRNEAMDVERIHELQKTADRELYEAKARWLIADPDAGTIAERVDTLVNHSALLVTQGRWSEIPPAVTPLIENPDTLRPQLLFKRGMAWFHLGEMALAERDFAEEAGRFGESMDLLVHRALALESLGRQDEAARNWEQVGEQLSPDEMRSIKLRARALAMSRRPAAGDPPRRR